MTCQGPECTRDAVAKDLCGSHYQQQRRGIPLTVLNGKRGFASLSPARQREIASLGGIEAHKKGRAHEWSSEEARLAGQKGGRISRGGRGRLVEQAA